MRVRLPDRTLPLPLEGGGSLPGKVLPGRACQAGGTTGAKAQRHERAERVRGACQRSHAVAWGREEEGQQGSAG